VVEELGDDFPALLADVEVIGCEQAVRRLGARGSVERSFHVDATPMVVAVYAALDCVEARDSRFGA
jgi:hypothetical protein